MDALATTGLAIPASLPEFWAQYGQGLLTLTLWIVGGVLVDRLVAYLLSQRATKKGTRISRAIGLSFRGLVTWIAAAIGFWIAFYQTPLPSQINQDLSMWLKLVSALIVTAFLGRLGGNLIMVYTERENTVIPSGSIFKNVTSIMVWIVGLAVMLNIMGVSLTPLLTALGVGGIAVGLALQPTLDNLFSGIQILASRQIEPGDFVRLEGGEEGTVEDVTWRNTTIRRAAGDLVIVPNSILGKSLIINFSRSNQAFRLVVTTTVRYGTDPALLERIALDVAHQVIAESPSAHKDTEPSVAFVDVGPSGITFNTVLPVVSYEERVDVRSLYVDALQRRLTEEGIEAPLPMVGVARA